MCFFCHCVPLCDVCRVSDYRFVREDDLHRLLAEEKAVEDRYLSRSQRIDAMEREYYAKWGALGLDLPPPPEPNLLDLRLLPPSRQHMLFLDTSELPSNRFAMAFRDKSGCLREPTEEEYQFVRKQEKGIYEFTYIKYHSQQTPM